MSNCSPIFIWHSKLASSVTLPAGVPQGFLYKDLNTTTIGIMNLVALVYCSENV